MFMPSVGQWVMFSLKNSKEAVKNGAWKTRSNKLCGIYIGASSSPEGVVLKPPRIMLVDEKGDNVRAVVAWQVHDLWVLPEDGPVDDLASQGCIGVASDLEPVDHKDDVPPGRRPAFHPADLRKPRKMPTRE
jgi:hypothetical protein